MKLNKLLKSLTGLALVSAITISMAACGSTGDSTGSGDTADSGKYSDTITVVYYPNDSSSDSDQIRQHIEDMIAKATGKKVIGKPTTDYNIAIEALANGTAQVAPNMGALGYIQAHDENDAVLPLFVHSGASGTLDDAVYYSRICALKGQEQNYMKDGQYSIDNIQGKKMSFVSASSTSGFLFPASSIVSYFSQQSQWKDITTDDLAEGGSGKFFSQVDFGNSHQGSAVNLLSGKDDVAAFDDIDIDTYVTAASGDVKTAGSVFEVKEGAEAPFDTVVGKQFVILQALPVMNGPFGYNSDTLSPEDAKAIQDAFTSAEAANDPLLFQPEGATAKGLYEKSGQIKFMTIDDSWYDPIREMIK